MFSSERRMRFEMTYSIANFRYAFVISFSLASRETPRISYKSSESVAMVDEERSGAKNQAKTTKDNKRARKHTGEFVCQVETRTSHRDSTRRSWFGSTATSLMSAHVITRHNLARFRTVHESPGSMSLSSIFSLILSRSSYSFTSKSFIYFLGRNLLCMYYSRSTLYPPPRSCGNRGRSRPLEMQRYARLKRAEEGVENLQEVFGDGSLMWAYFSRLFSFADIPLYLLRDASSLRHQPGKSEKCMTNKGSFEGREE